MVNGINLQSLGKVENILNLYFCFNKLDKYTVYCGFCFIRTKHEFKYIT